MDIKSIRLIRDKYRDVLAADADYNEALSVLTTKPLTVPITDIKEIEPEDDFSYNTEQKCLAEILLDMHSVDQSIQEIKNELSQIIESTNESLELIQNSINKQLSQINDINTLCGQESNYNMIVPIYVSDFEDTSAEFLDDKTMGASLLKSKEVSYDVVSIVGNGYSGNSFVYENGEFAADIDDRSNLEYIFDINDTTIYEYSRLYADQKQKVSSPYINYDNSAVECTVTLNAAEDVCKAYISSPDKNLCITKIETSSDGIRYVNRLAKPIYINDISKIYDNSTYIYGSNTICFPYTKFVRITFSNNELADDEIRIEEDGVLYKTSAKRKKIGIAGIYLFKSSYEEAALISKDVVEDGSLDRISLFASEYIPDHFPDDVYITYALIINGKEYPVVPANSGQDGVALIKYAEGSAQKYNNIQTIEEMIHTVKVKIIISSYNGNESPYISNLKLCIGKDTGDLYV